MLYVLCSFSFYMVHQFNVFLADGVDCLSHAVFKVLNLWYVPDRGVDRLRDVSCLDLLRGDWSGYQKEFLLFLFEG